MNIDPNDRYVNEIRLNNFAKIFGTDTNSLLETYQHYENPQLTYGLIRSEIKNTEDTQAVLKEKITELCILYLLTEKEHLIEFAKRLNVMYLPSASLPDIFQQITPWIQEIANKNWPLAIPYYSSQKKIPLTKRVDSIFKNEAVASDIVKFYYVHTCIDKQILASKLEGPYQKKYEQIFNSILVFSMSHDKERTCDLIKKEDPNREQKVNMPSLKKLSVEDYYKELTQYALNFPQHSSLNLGSLEVTLPHF